MSDSVNQNNINQNSINQNSINQGSINQDNINPGSINQDNTNQDSESKKKKGFTFKKFLLIYVVIWLVITGIVSLVLWKKLDAYQENYNLAKEAANPDLAAENYKELFNYENIRTTAADLFSEISPYETKDNWIEYLESVYDEDSVSICRIADFSETKPEYEIKDGEEIIGKLVLTETGDADKYGFHNYELKKAEVLIDSPKLQSYKIKLVNADNIMVNANVISENAVAELITDSIHDIAAEETTNSFSYDNYEISGFIKEPVITVDGKELSFDEDNTVIYLNSCDKEFEEEQSENVINAAEAYIYVMNSVKKFGAVSGYLVENGEAYKAILSALSGLAWAGAPDEFEITSSEIKEFWQYDEEHFVVISHHTMHRLYRKETYNEEMTIESLYELRNGKWLISNMALKR